MAAWKHFCSAIVPSLFLASIVLCSCRMATESPAGPERDNTAAVRKVVSDILAADNAGDLEMVRNLYTEDAIWIPPAGPTIEGREEILSRYHSTFASNTLDYSFQTAETQVFGPWAFTRGTTRGRVIPRDGSEPKETHDKFLMILHREADGSWKIARLMWSPTGPTPQ